MHKNKKTPWHIKIYMYVVKMHIKSEVKSFRVLHVLVHCFAQMVSTGGGGLAQWLGRRISDQGVPGSSPGLAPFVVALSKSHLPPA